MAAPPNRVPGEIDAELLELREDYDDLTEVAQQGRLREELQRRKLWKPLDAPAPLQEDPYADPNPQLSGEWTFQELQDGGVALATFDSDEDAALHV